MAIMSAMGNTTLARIILPRNKKTSVTISSKKTVISTDTISLADGPARRATATIGNSVANNVKNKIFRVRRMNAGSVSSGD